MKPFLSNTKYSTLLDYMVDIASGNDIFLQNIGIQYTAKNYTIIDIAKAYIIDIAKAYDAGRRFDVPESLRIYFTHALFKAKQEEQKLEKERLKTDPELEEYKRLQAKFALLDA